MDFFLIFSYKILKLYFIFIFSGLTRVDSGWPMKPGTRPLGRVNPWAGFNNYGTTVNFFLLSFFLSLLTLGFTLNLPKFNCVLQLVFNSILVLIISIAICVDFNDFLFFISISPMNILFHLIFTSNLLLILLIAIFYPFPDLFFNFIPQYFISFNFCIQF